MLPEGIISRTPFLLDGPSIGDGSYWAGAEVSVRKESSATYCPQDVRMRLQRTGWWTVYAGGVKKPPTGRKMRALRTR